MLPSVSDKMTSWIRTSNLYWISTALQPGRPEGGKGGMSKGTSFHLLNSPLAIAPFPLEATVNTNSLFFGNVLANAWSDVVDALKITSWKWWKKEIQIQMHTRDVKDDDHYRGGIWWGDGAACECAGNAEGKSAADGWEPINQTEHWLLMPLNSRCLKNQAKHKPKEQEDSDFNVLSTCVLLCQASQFSGEERSDFFPCSPTSARAVLDVFPAFQFSQKIQRTSLIQNTPSPPLQQN